MLHLSRGVYHVVIILGGQSWPFEGETSIGRAEMNQKWSKSEAVITATSDHEEDQRKEEAEYLGSRGTPGYCCELIIS